ASLIDWRAAFVLLAIPGFWLARELWRTVPEPLRGGQSHLAPGVLDLGEALAAASAQGAGRRAPDAEAGPREPEQPAAAEAPRREAAQEAARRLGAIPNPKLVLHEDSRQMGLARSVRYII